jgi:hypothetical protein
VPDRPEPRALAVEPEHVREIVKPLDDALRVEREAAVAHERGEVELALADERFGSIASQPRSEQLRRDQGSQATASISGSSSASAVQKRPPSRERWSRLREA